MTKNIEVFTQNSIRIQDGDRTIYIDPFAMKMEPHDADVILITHDHYDHFSPEDIQKVANAATMVVMPEKMSGKAREELASAQLANVEEQVVTMKPGAFLEVRKWELETMPAYNERKSFHPKSAGWVGYILRSNGKRIYIAGDTDATKEAKSVQCDIALIPIGGTYTMDAKEAAGLINTIQPEVAIPTHYGSIVGKPSDGEVFVGLVHAPVRVELKIAF